ncbi:GNAT family N-acetyltransferase [uncultured Shewanella sp.]|uniref:GNAT family N-acetyltransferase n=1 Tax=uncultured Shewanella sp. TaxID=173975 RepID=UPI002635206E|nr:GNAT family N-acetyltransferase [uncultured Shewanella sp.]
MTPIKTERLIIRQVTEDDAAFIMTLYNEPTFIQGVGDRGVSSLALARQYINEFIIKSYAENGYGSFLIVLKGCNTPIGVCGLLKRDYREDVELGYGLVYKYWSKGYAIESCQAVLNFGVEALGLSEFIAVTSLDNNASIKTLERLDFKFETVEKLAEYDDESKLFRLVKL